MKGNEKVIATLNDLLSDELTAVNQYMVHAGMDENWGYEKLHDAVEKRAITEMKHAESLIDRLLFLEGMPIVSNLKKISIGAKVEAQLAHDLEAEIDAVKGYNAGIKLAVEVGDNGTRELFEVHPEGRGRSRGLAGSPARPDRPDGHLRLPGRAALLKNSIISKK